VGRLVKASVVRFSLKDFRSTFLQDAKDRGVNIGPVSRAMRHSSTATTEAFYARIRSQAAFDWMKERLAAVPAEPITR